MVNPNNLRVRKSGAGGAGRSSSQTNQNKNRRQKSDDNEDLHRKFIDEITTKRSLAFSEETVRDEIVKYFGDHKANGVELSVFKMSLIDQISKTRIRIPVRSVKCFTFPHCFDLKQFLNFNFAAEQSAKKAKKGKRKADAEKAEKRLWECPVTNCHQSATRDQLRLDGYFEAVLDAVQSDTVEVKLFPDGRWEEIEQEEFKEITLLNATSGEREIAQIIPRKRPKINGGENSTNSGKENSRKSNGQKTNCPPFSSSDQSQKNEEEKKEREKEREKTAMEIECLTTLLQFVREEKQAETDRRIVAERELETVREKASATSKRCLALELELAEERARSKKVNEEAAAEKDSITQKYERLEQDYWGAIERLLCAELEIDAKNNQTIELLKEEHMKALSANRLETEALKKQQEESTKLIEEQILLIQQLQEEKSNLNAELASSKDDHEKLLEKAPFSTAQLEKSLREKAQLKTLLEEKENIIDKLKAELAETSAKYSHMEETLKSQLEERQNAELAAVSTTEMTEKMDYSLPPSPVTELRAEEVIIMAAEGVLPDNNNNNDSVVIVETNDSDETRMATTTPTNELIGMETSGMVVENEIEDGNSEVTMQKQGVVVVAANTATIVQGKWGTFSTPAASRTDPLEEASTILFVSERIKEWIECHVGGQAMFFPLSALVTFFQLPQTVPLSGALPKSPSFIIWLCPDVLSDFSDFKSSLLKFLKAVSTKGFTFYVGGQRKNAKNLCILIAEILSTVTDAQLFSRGAKAAAERSGSEARAERNEELFCYMSNKHAKGEEEDSVRVVENLFSLCAQFQKTSENRGERDDENGEQEEKSGDLSLSESPLPSASQAFPSPTEETPRQNRSMMSMDGATKTASSTSTGGDERRKSILTSGRRRIIKAQLKASKAKKRPSGSGETDGVGIDTANEVIEEDEGEKKAKEKRETPPLSSMENNQKQQETPKRTKRRSSIASSNADPETTTIGSSSKDNEKQRSPLIKTKTPTKKRLPPWHSASKVGNVEKDRRRSRSPLRSRMSGGSDAKKSSENGFRPFSSLFTGGGYGIAREGAWQLAHKRQ